MKKRNFFACRSEFGILVYLSYKEYVDLLRNISNLNIQHEVVVDEYEYMICHTIIKK